jgi:DNA (cytosine-5)-methyltransferase 1
MLRVIEEFRPTWIIGENVAGILTVVEPDGSTGVARQDSFFGDANEEVRDYNTVVGRIDRELGAIGYETLWFVIPACAVNAPHRRDRIWIIAHAIGDEHRGRRGSIREKKGVSGKHRPEIRSGRPGRTGKDDGDTFSSGRSGNARRRPGEELENGLERSRIAWERNWLEVATEFCGVDDGLPSGVDGLKLSKSKHREKRLQALGNAIVPQVVMEIMRAIKEKGVK